MSNIIVETHPGRLRAIDADLQLPKTENLNLSLPGSQKYHLKKQ